MFKKSNSLYLLFTTVTILSFSTGCAVFAPTEVDLNRLQVGDNKKRVQKLLGRPTGTSVFEKSKLERWHYEVYLKRSGRTYPYIVLFEKELVKDWYFDTLTAAEEIATLDGRANSRTKDDIKDPTLRAIATFLAQFGEIFRGMK